MEAIAVEPHRGTLEVIRRITDDGILTEREVYDLAEYLNENREARAAWPGHELFDVLHEVFEDGILSQVEHQCAETRIATPEAAPAPAPATSPPTLSMDLIKVEKYELPRVPKTVKIPCKPSGESYRVDLAKHTCTCPAWYGNRKRFAIGNPRRACVHIVDAFWREIQEGNAKNTPRIFTNMIEELSQRGRGICHQAEWKLLRVEQTPHVVSVGHPEWNTIYAPGVISSSSCRTAEPRPAPQNLPPPRRTLDPRRFNVQAPAILWIP